MKLSIGLFAAASAVGTDDPAFERPEICSDLDANYVNCWKPYGHFSNVATVSDGNSTESVHSDWFRQTNDGGECGFQYIDGSESYVNKTCSTFTPIPGAELVVGNAFFVAKGSQENSIVGFDITGDINIVQKWDVTFDFSQDFNLKLAAHIDAIEEANENNSTQPEPFSYDETFPCFDLTNSYAPGIQARLELESEFSPEVLVPFFPISDCFDSNPDGSAYSDYAIMFTNQHAGDKNNNYAIANYGESGNFFTVKINGKSCVNWGFTPHDPHQATIQIVQNQGDCVFNVIVDNAAAQLLYFQGSVDEGVIDFINDVQII